MQINLKAIAASVVLSLLGGIFIGAKYCPNVFEVKGFQPPGQCIAEKIKRKIEKKFDPNSGKLLSESIIEDVTKPLAMPKPLFKLTILSVYDVFQKRWDWAAMYEKPYTLPLMGDAWLGVYVSNQYQVGVSFSKEFY